MRSALAEARARGGDLAPLAAAVVDGMVFARNFALALDDS